MKFWSFPRSWSQWLWIETQILTVLENELESILLTLDDVTKRGVGQAFVMPFDRVGSLRRQQSQQFESKATKRHSTMNPDQTWLSSRTSFSFFHYTSTSFSFSHYTWKLWHPSTSSHTPAPIPAFNLSHSFSTCPSLYTYASFLGNSPKTRSRICLVLMP